MKNSPSTETSRRLCDHSRVRGCYRERSRSAFSLLEVFIALGILAVALGASIGTIAQINNNRRELDQAEKIARIMEQVLATIENVDWNSLGKISTPTDPASLALHRRATGFPGSGNAGGINPPMTEQDLVTAGILSSLIGIQGLNIYVEYYRMETLDRINKLNDAPISLNTRDAWFGMIGHPRYYPAPTFNVGNWFPGIDPKQYIPDENPTLFDLNTLLSTIVTQNLAVGATPRQDDGMLIRVLISWVPIGLDPAVATAQTRLWRESFLARRK